jgi:hypothetical protein
MRTRRLQRWAPVVLASLLAAALTAGVAVGAGRDDDGGKNGKAPHVVGLWGDVPYSEAQTSAGVPNLIADMNREKLAFSVHDGDIKSGSSRCDNPVYAQFEAFLDALEAAAVYTPGDNEWTDCDRANNGSYSSAERLAYIRANLFDTQTSYGKRELRLEVQAAPYVENRRWHFGGVTYATLHVVGSDNNCSGDVGPDPAECAARSAATNQWLRAAFDAAEVQDSPGIMLVIQGNPGFDTFDGGTPFFRSPPRNPQTLNAASGSPDGYTDFLRALREETIAFGNPVVLVHGDSHYFRVDKPLLDAAGNRIENFTRVETPGNNAQSGSNDVQWVSVEVDPRDDEVFTFQQEVVRANVPAYQP